MKIFLSYSSQDRSIVSTVATDLEALGYDAWFDQELTGGTDWWNTILTAIRECDIFVFCLTPQSLQSHPCELEREYAHALGKPILPILLKDVDMQALPLLLTRLQYVDYRKHDRNSVLLLNKALRAIPAAPPLPNPLPPAPQVPLSTMYKLVEQADAPNLSFEQQAAFLIGIEELWEQGQHPRIVDLLEKFLSRPDLAANIRNRSMALLAKTKRKKAPSKAVTFGMAGLVIVGIALFAIVMSSNLLKGEVAAVATSTATTAPSQTPLPTHTNIPATAVPTKVIPSDTPTHTPTLPPTIAPTQTAPPTLTNTSTPLPTNTPTETPTYTPTTIPTATPNWTATAEESIRLTEQSVQLTQAAVAQNATAKANARIAMTQAALKPIALTGDKLTFDPGGANGNGGQQSPLSLTAGAGSGVYGNFPQWKYFVNAANFEVTVRVTVPSQPATTSARVAGITIQNDSDITSLTWAWTIDNTQDVRFGGSAKSIFGSSGMNANNTFYGDQKGCFGNDVLLKLTKIGPNVNAACAIPGGSWQPIGVTIAGYIPQYGNENLIVSLFAYSIDEQSITARFSEFTFRRLS